MKSIYTTKDIAFMQEHYKDMSYKEIADSLGFSERQIRGKINNMGLSKNRKYNLDFFKNINSANKAYWLGFIYADGNIFNGALNIEVKYDDEEILHSFIKDFNSNISLTQRERDITFNGYSYHTHTSLIRIYCKEVCKQLVEHGIVPNKTYRPEYPRCSQYFWHFVRGFLDGDGCLHVDKNGRIIISFTNPNESFLRYLNDEINTRLSIKGYIYKEKEWKYKLYYNRQEDVKQILECIYDLTECNNLLKRKYNVYQTFLGLAI